MAAHERGTLVVDPLTVLQAMTGHAVLAADANGVIVYCNDAAQRMHGLVNDEAVGRATLTDLFGSPRDGADVHQWLADQLIDGTQGWAGEIECRHTSGTWFAVDLVATPCPAGDLLAAGMALVYRAVPSRREPAGVAPDGESRLAVPAAAVPGADVLSKLGHELRSPLAGIVGLARILLMRLNAGQSDPAQQARQLEMIESSAGRSLATIERVVDVAKIESGGVGGDRRLLDGRTAVADVVEAFGTAAEERGLRLRADVPAHPVMISADVEVLGRLLRELVDNAVRFTDSGDVLVRIHAGEDQAVVVEVSDGGPGIPAGEQTRIFDAFERGALAAERDDDGCGLGLYLARKLAALLGAHLSVHSQTGQGTTFTTTFPEPGGRSPTGHSTHPRSST